MSQQIRLGSNPLSPSHRIIQKEKAQHVKVQGYHMKEGVRIRARSLTPT